VSSTGSSNPTRTKWNILELLVPFLTASIFGLGFHLTVGSLLLTLLASGFGFVLGLGLFLIIGFFYIMDREDD
jgi:hypothetical protein